MSSPPHKKEADDQSISRILKTKTAFHSWKLIQRLSPEGLAKKIHDTLVTSQIVVIDLGRSGWFPPKDLSQRIATVHAATKRKEFRDLNIAFQEVRRPLHKGWLNHSLIVLKKTATSV